MIFEELMQGYMDGALSDADQTEFFHIMSVSPEKRAEFNEHVAIRAMIVKDRASEMAPAALERSVLAAASAQEPVAGSVVINAGGGAATATIKAVLAIAAGGIIAGGIAGYIAGANRGASRQLAASAVVTPAGEVQQNAPAGSVPAVMPPNHGFAVTHRVGRAALATIQQPFLTSPAANKNLPEAPIAGISSPTVEQARSSSAVFSSETTVGKLIFTGNIPVEHAVPLLLTPIQAVPEKPLQDFGGRNEFADAFDASHAPHWQVELQQGSGILFPRFSSPALGAAPFVNYSSFRIGMLLTPEAALGVCGGQSDFALKYASTPNALTSITYLQNSNIAYGGMYFQYAFAPVLGFTPQALLELGASSLGPLYDAQAMLAYPINRFVYAQFGALATGLFYRHETVWFASQKIGLTLGIGTEF